MKTIAGLRWSVMVLGAVLAAPAQAQAIVGRTAGEASVTATGAARYVVPLALPPGTNGLAPALAVTYDSRSGNGLLGVGFRLSGLSTIRRCGSTPAQDGRWAAVALEPADRYCLDGQRLRLTSGTYGQAGSQYQTENESFARVTALGTAGTGPASFRVERRDGLIHEYGATGDSRVESAGSTTPREWALNRVLDRSGNYADFVYAEDWANGSHRPLRIDYAGNTRTGAAPYYSVRFTYEARPAGDSPSGYVAGGIVSETSRLDRVDVVHIGSNGVVRSFDLAYEAGSTTGRSRLTRLQACAPDGCLAPTQFSWSSVSAGWSVYMGAAIPTDRYPTAIPGDVNGDGFDDLTYHDSTLRRWMVLPGGPFGFQQAAVDTGLGVDSDPAQALPADLDGNGKRDVLVMGSGNYWHWLRHKSGGTYAYTATGVINPAPPGGLMAADIDGDGRDDLVYVKTAGTAIYWKRNQTVTSSSYAAEAVLWSVPAGTRLPAAPFIETTQRFRSIVRNGDVNGDGRADLLVRVQQSTCGTSTTCATWIDRWQVLASDGSALVAQRQLDGNAEVLLADFNADGLTDIGYWTPGGTWQLLLAGGSRGATLATFAGPITTSAPAPAAGGRTMVIDWDADGRTDLLQPISSGELRYCRSTGTSLEACQPAGITPGTIVASPMTLDINGDAYPDLVYAMPTVRLHLHHQVPPDMLVAATDGFGLRSTFEYGPLSDAAVHKVGSAAAFPVRDLARPGFVVTTMTREDARGSQHETYFYEGARVHVQGRGFLGFARRTVTALHDSLARVEEFHQDTAAPDRIGLPLRITLQQRSGVPLKRTTYEWQSHAYGAGYETRRFAYPASVAVQDYELDGVQVSTTTTNTAYDTFGSPLEQSETTVERAKGLNAWAQHSRVTTLGGVVNDTANWCLGRPASTQVRRFHTLPGGAPVTRSVAHGWDYALCRPLQQVVEPASPTLRVATDFAYDAYGNVASIAVTPAGQALRTTTQSWVDNGRFRGSTTNPEGHVETTHWDPVAARPTAVVDANGLGTRLWLDGFGRLTRATRPDGTSTVVSRSLCGGSCPLATAHVSVTVAERDTADEHITSTETGYDRHGREVYQRAESPGGVSAFRTRRYTSRGELWGESVPGPCCAAPTRWINHAYDLLGRRISVDQPASEADPTRIVTRWRHDGLSVTETDALGRSTTRWQDAVGNVLRVVDPGLAATNYEYDAFGNLLKTRQVDGTEATVTYDVRGLRRSYADPNAGTWTYDYFPLGEVRSQINARGQTTTYAYDRLSRVVSRVEPEGTTTWTWGNSATSRNIGGLASVSAPGFQETYQYDSLGRPSSVTTKMAGKTLVSRQTFDAVTGAQDTFIYPASTGSLPLRVRHHYERGRLARVSDADAGTTYWQLNAVNPFGQAVDETLGNGVRVVSGYDAVTGRLLSRVAGVGGSNALQNLAFAWDAAGNLIRREERNAGGEEQFAYDGRDRLDDVRRGGSLVLDLGYDDAGNLTYKSDVGSYRYDAVRKHAVLAAGLNSYAYDANGAVADASGTSIAWTSYDLPGEITHPAGNYSAFYYGPDRARYRQVARAGGGLADTLYAAGGLYERVNTDGTVIHRHYVLAEGRRVAVQTRKSGASPVTVYLLEDHLGGVDGFTSASGALLARTSYQPFGARRSGDGLAPAPTQSEWQQIQSVTPRGYTGHEHLDNLGLIHMNGRVYDPALGRFLSPDPVVQAPYDSQGLNRYAYVRNNPLRNTDPTGHCTYGYPGSNLLGQYCLENLIVGAPRLREDLMVMRWMQPYWSHPQPLADSRETRGTDASGDGSATPPTSNPGGLPTVVVTAPRPPHDAQLPTDMQLLAGYNLLLSRFIDRLFVESTRLGESAVEYYVDQESTTGNPLYRIPGAAAALWTPSTAPYTSLLLGLGAGLGAWSARPFWQYYPAGNIAYRSTWLTRGSGWSPPYQSGQQAASMLALPAYNPGTAVRAFQPRLFDYVHGPRISEPQPTFGPHAVGGGVEYRVIPFSE